MPDTKLLDRIKAHVEQWKASNGYDCPFDYHGLQFIIEDHEAKQVILKQFMTATQIIERIKHHAEQYEPIPDKSETDLRVFIDATLTASFIYYGDRKEIVIPINGVYFIKNKHFENLNQYLTDTYGSINYKGNLYEKDSVAYTVTYRSLNSL